MLVTMAACMNTLSVFVFTFALGFAIVSASDPGSLQDFCVADLQSGAKLNGYPCKDPATVVAEDFYSSMLANPGGLNDTCQVAITGANVQKVAGLNTLGVAVGRIDYAVGGVNGFHIHPRASEVVFVLDGEIEVGFITTSNTLIAKQIRKGEVFIFPRGLMHYQKNIGLVPAAVFTAFDSQLPGTQAIGPALFGSTPPVASEVLAMAFKLDPPVVQDVKNKFAARK